MRDALAALPWVHGVGVSFEEKEAVVQADVSRLDTDALVRAVEEAGFTAHVLD